MTNKKKSTRNVEGLLIRPGDPNAVAIIARIRDGWHVRAWLSGWSGKPFITDGDIERMGAHTVTLDEL